MSYNLGLADAPDAYGHFDNRDKGGSEVVLNPGQTLSTIATGEARRAY